MLVSPPPNQSEPRAETTSRLYTEPAGRPLLTLEKMDGLVLMLQGKPVGEAWISPRERARTAAGIEETCRNGPPWDAGRPPILILNRRISQLDITALRSCGLDFHADYELLAPAKDTIKLQVYVPRAERAARTP